LEEFFNEKINNSS